jgi:DNA-binding CsgD family transcriptional regulator
VDGESRAREKEPEASAQSRFDAAAATLLGIEAMNALSVGIVIVDRRGLVAFANAKGEDLLKRRAIFRRGDSLVLCDTESHEGFRRALAAACAQTSAAIQLRDRDANPVLSAVIVPLATAAAGASSAPKILLAMNELFPARTIPSVWLSQLFGLTPAESSVTNWLVSGRTIDEYAQDRGVSLATVRSQIKAVLAKTGMSRQVQLVAALARLPIECAAT